MSAMFRVRSVRVGALALSLMLLVVMPLSPVQAVDTPGSVHGFVVAALGGAPVEAIEVTLEKFESGEWASVIGKSTETDGPGAYSILDIDPGTYRLAFEDPDSDGSKTYLPAFKDVEIASGGVLDAGTTALVVGGTATGHVQNDSDIDLGGVTVQVYQEGNLEHDFPVYTDASGNFTATGLATGNYSFSFIKEGYVNEYYDNQPWEAGPDFTGVNFVHVVEGEAIPVSLPNDVVLSVAGSISGTVTTANGAPFAARVRLYASTSDDYNDAAIANGATGAYTILGLQPGDYVLSFVDQVDFALATEFYDNSPTRAGATLVHVTAGQVAAGKDAVLELPVVVSPPPPPVPPLFGSSFSGGIKGGKKKATVSVKVRFSNVKTKKVKGSVYVYEGARFVKKGSFKKGKGKFKVKAKKGFHTYTVTFNGGANYGTKTFTKTVRVK